MYNKVELCGVNTSRLPVLSNEEIYALLRRIRAGDAGARDELVMGNLRLVLSVIQRFSGRGEMMDDLFQVGCIGLIKAIDNFNLDLEVRFSTYAVPMILGEVRRYLRDHSMVRVSRSLRDLACRAMQTRERLMADSAREPTADEVAAAMGVPREEVVFALDAMTDPVSLYEPLYADGTESVCVMDQVRDTENTDESWLEQIALDDAIDRLSRRERSILRLRFYEGKTQMEVAGAIGISQAQVSRVEKSALGKMRKQL